MDINFSDFVAITSTQNEHVKNVVKLQRDSATRRERNLTVVEGRRELRIALASGAKVAQIFWCAELTDLPHPVAEADECFRVSKAVYQKIAYRDTTEGLLATIQPPARTLEQFQPEHDNPLVIVVERVEKPGNLGAILRTADAAGVDAVMVCDEACDLYNPNVIRASIGSVFSVPAFTLSSEACIAWLKRHEVQILTAQLQDSLPYYDVDMTRATAIVMGTEATGLTQAWRDAADAHILIPMAGMMDSLNVSVSTAILTFEAVRQRRG